MSVPASPPQYRVRDGDALIDREAALAVWRGNLGQDARMAEKYDWFYLHAPSGMPLLQLLMHAEESEPVGICTAGRRRMLREGKIVRAGILVDLAVMPMHRSLGPALMLQQGMYEAGRRELDLIYSFPNPKATPVFKRIGYRHLADMIRHVRVVRHALYMQRRFPRLPTGLASIGGAIIDFGSHLRDTWRFPRARALRAQWSDQAPDIDAMWRASPKTTATIALRDAAYLRWRFDDAPAADGQRRFQHLQLFDNDGISAWFATRTDGHTMQIHDFWSRDGARPSPDIVAALLRSAREKGYAALSIELATSEDRLQPWRELGFEARSRRPVFGADHAFPDGMPDLHLTSADEDE